MLTTATLHGIGVGGSLGDYAEPFFRNLRRAGAPAFRGVELFWRGAWLGPLAYWLLGTDWFMAAAQAPLDRLLADGALPTRTVLVTHSAGCRIAWDWYGRRQEGRDDARGKRGSAITSGPPPRLRGSWRPPGQPPSENHPLPIV